MPDPPQGQESLELDLLKVFVNDFVGQWSNSPVRSDALPAPGIHTG
jgi:hypothetical protein